MSKADNSRPKGGAWFWMTRELLLSAAWRSLGINARRVVEFLIVEHMTHGGKKNGSLTASYRRLAEFGVNRRFAGDAIGHAEKRGLIECCRGDMGAPTTYSLTWFPLSDGTPPTNKWRAFVPYKRKVRLSPNR